MGGQPSRSSVGGPAAAARFQNAGVLGRPFSFQSYGSGRAGFNQPEFASSYGIGGFGNPNLNPMGTAYGVGNPVGGSAYQDQMLSGPMAGSQSYSQAFGSPDTQGIASQIGTGAPAPNVGQSFVQASLGSSKGDANYDAFSDFNNDGVVTTADFGEYMKANPGGQASMVESQQSIDNRANAFNAAMDRRQSLMNQMRTLDQGLGSVYGYQPFPAYGMGYRGMYGGFKDGGLIKGYQDGGMMMDPRVEDSMMSTPNPQGASAVDPSMTMDMSSPDNEMLQIVLDAKAALEGNHPNPEMALEKFIEIFGEDELMSLKDFVMRSMDSDMSQPMSDGMSDSIPGVIDGVEPVALSEGEYIVPADVVSGLGNGDTDSGALAMRNMINKVRSVRNGSPVQPPAIDPSMMMA